MKHSRLFFAPIASLFVVACSSGSSGIPAGAVDAAPPMVTNDSDGGDSGTVTGNGKGKGKNADGGSDAAAPVALPFTPSNLPAGFVVKADGDEIVSKSCLVDTDALTTDCFDDGFAFESFAQPAGGAFSVPDLAVLSLGSIMIAQDTIVTVKGARAFVLVASRDVKIAGAIDASAKQEKAGPGGFSGSASQNADGNGPGAGKMSDGIMFGGGGGSMCGYGGNDNHGEPPHKVKTSVSELVVAPLFGGSSGGSGFQSGGGGGGAIQIVSGATFTLEANGSVRANGGGTPFGGNGGGSGGAIIVEAVNVVENGKLLANGGGGSANDDVGDVDAHAGKDGSLDMTAAPGGTGTNAGGAGNPGDGNYGTAGTYDMPVAGGLGDYGGGGGGGAGMIVVRFANPSAASGSPAPNAKSNCYDRRQDIVLKK